MKTRAVTAVLAALLAPVVVASCVATTPSPIAAPDQVGTPAASSQLAHEVTLRVDPVRGEISPVTPRQVLAVVEAAMMLDFDVANLTQTGNTTSFQLLTRNRGAAVTGLQFRTVGQRTMTAPAQPVMLGDLPPAGESMTTLSFANPSGEAFTVTLYLQATIVATGTAPSTGGTSTPTSAPTAAPTTTPTAAPTSTPTAAPTPTPTTAPTSAPTPTPAPTATPAATPPPAEGVTDPGPSAARGRVLMNGKASYQRISLSLIRSAGWVTRTVTTDAQGYVNATGLEPGDYLLYFYNDSNRERIGYWRSRNFRVDATRGAAFPTIDFYQKGLLNDPPMDARRSLPTTFTWLPQTQAVDYYRFRVHSQGGRTFHLIHQSNKIPGTATTFTWDGANVSEPLTSTNRYFWGVFWDAGLKGEGGNLYQSVYFNP